MNSSEIKNKLLWYWKWKRQYKFVATEAGCYNADVLVSNGKEIIECEVKIDKRDLRNDFKKRKHVFYSKEKSNHISYYENFIPNKFFFAVPECLVDEAKLLCEGKPYGVIKALDNNQKLCRIVKRAKLLHSRFNNRLHEDIISRTMNELVTLRMKHYR
jgi:hypothetical protein